MHTSLLNLAAFLSKKVPSQTLTLFLKLRKLLMYDHPGCNARVRVGFGVFFFCTTAVSRNVLHRLKSDASNAMRIARHEHGRLS